MKNWTHSKTVWLNLLTVLISVAGLITPMLGGWGLPDSTIVKIDGIVLFVVGVVNIVLRIYFTNKPIANGLS